MKVRISERMSNFINKHNKKSNFAKWIIETEKEKLQNMNKCSFCGSSDVKSFLTGQGDALICESCIDIGREYFDENKSNNVLDTTPKSIKKQLDEYVIGQDNPKKVLSVAIYNHMVKTENNLDIQKGNILLIGPTGSGKTLLAQSLAKILDVPFAMADATTLTEAGYIGEDIETVIQPLLQRCDFDVEKASKGIIFIDEIDKKRDNNIGSPSTTARGVSSTGVQYGLLKLIEGTVANVHPIGSRKHPHQQCIQVDTSNILFIFGGAFNGLSDIIANRLGKNKVGFNEKEKLSKSERDSNLLKHMEQDDLIEFGLIPELVGRIPILAVLDELNINDLCRILTEPKGNLIDQYKTLLSQDNIKVNFPDKTVHSIAETAFNKKIGARGLKTVIENLMLDFMFDRVNGGEFTVNI